MSKFKAAISKWCKGTSNNLNKKQETIPFKRVRHFNEIPGPEALPVIGNTFRFIPGIAQFATNNTEKFLQQMHDKYGDIVKLEGIPLKRPIVFLFSPSLAREMYEKEGKWPIRDALDSLKHYSDVKGRHVFSSSQGKEWRKLRTKVNKVILSLPFLDSCIEKIDEVTFEFVHNMGQMRNVKSFELPDDFLNELKKLALETIFVVALDYRLGGLQPHLSKSHDAQRIIDANAKWFELMYKLEKLPLWKHLGSTPTLRRFFQAADTVTETSAKYVDYALNRLENQSTSKMSNYVSMLERLLQQMSEEQAKTVITRGTIPGAIGTIANTVGAALYATATNPDVQAKLFAELRAVLPEVDSPFTKETYQNVPYLKACLKETLRMFPTVLGNTRTMARDIVLGGFTIPKGVSVFAAHGIMSLRSEQFPEPLKFTPERWLANCDLRTANEAHAYAVLPFGKGPRTCVARYLAVREMTIFIARIVRTFELQWRYEPLRFQHHLISTVQSPLKIQITDR